MTTRINYGQAKKYLSDFLNDPPDTDDCIIWPFSLDNNGYAQANWCGTTRKVSRVVLASLVGQPPEGMGRIESAHLPSACHNRACINPRHLRWATAAENNADKLLDGTHHRGERHGMSKLTDAAVRSIYADSREHLLIASEHGVSRQTVTNIKNGQTWAWLTGHRRAA